MKAIQLFKKTRFVIVYPCVATMLIIARTSEASMLWGGALVIIGESIRWRANGYVGHNKVNRTRKNEGQDPIGQLITSGPYSLVRHPLYLGTLFIAAGVCLVSGNILLSIIVLSALIIIYQKKMNEEDSLLEAECGEIYSEYKRKVSQLIPFKAPYKFRWGTWSWNGIVASNEWKTLLWLAVLFIGLYLREEWYQEQEFFDMEVKHIIFFVIMCLMITTDLVVTASKKTNAKMKAFRETHVLNL